MDSILLARWLVLARQHKYKWSSLICVHSTLTHLPSRPQEPATSRKNRMSCRKTKHCLSVARVPGYDAMAGQLTATTGIWLAGVQEGRSKGSTLPPGFSGAGWTGPREGMGGQYIKRHGEMKDRSVKDGNKGVRKMRYRQTWRQRQRPSSYPPPDLKLEEKTQDAVKPTVMQLQGDGIQIRWNENHNMGCSLTEKQQKLYWRCVVTFYGIVRWSACCPKIQDNK